MPTQKHVLSAFLHERRRGPARDIGDDLARFDPFFDRAERLWYGLAPSREIDQAAFCRAVRSATGEPIDAVSLVSLADGPGPRAASERPDYWSGCVARLATDARQFLTRCRDGCLKCALGPELCHDLTETIWQALAEQLWHSFEQNRWDELGQSPRLLVRAVVLETLFLYAGCIVTGDDAGVAALRPFMDALPQAIPLGERAGHPRHWLAISA